MTRFTRLCVFYALFAAIAATGRADTPVDELIGTWQIEAAWADGTALWAQAEYRQVLDGAFVEGRVFVRDGDGPLYQRYRSLFTGAEGPGAVVAHTFSADGSYAESRLQVAGSVITTEWSAGETTIAERMISFSWNAPPSQPDSRLARTWVVVETEALDSGHTHVRLTHLGFGEGPSWDETMAYFDKAWEYVLTQLENALTTE